MACTFCGEGDEWIKTCRIKDGSRIRVCDPCWEVLSQWLVIVPGDSVVTARCDQCGAYFNPREMAEFSPGGRYNAYSGTCGMCAKVGTAALSEALNRLRTTPNLPPVPPVEAVLALLCLGYRGYKKGLRGRIPPSVEELALSVVGFLYSRSA